MSLDNRLHKEPQNERVTLPKKWWRIFLKIGMWVIGLLLLLLIILAGVSFFIWKEHRDDIVDAVFKGYALAENVVFSDFITHQNSVIQDEEGTVLKELKVQEYEYIPYEAINPLFIQTVVAVEDERFFDHLGVDIYGTLRAAYQTIRGNGLQGGSTITQQVARNILMKNSDVKISRKVTEQVLAYELEKQLSKEEILAHYLNNIYFGHGNYGIGPASYYYFGKPQNELTAEEVAVIVGITNNPTLFDPITQPENAATKRTRILDKLIEKSIIPATYTDDIGPITLNVIKPKLDAAIEDEYLTFAFHSAVEALMRAQDFEFKYVFNSEAEESRYRAAYEEAYQAIRGSILAGGYIVTVNYDDILQKRVKQAAQSVITGNTSVQGSVVVIDNQKKQVVATIGSLQESTEFNRAYQAIRQPGSALKPIVTYAPLFESGHTLTTQLEDKEITDGPSNAYTGYRGTITILEAIRISTNTIPYQRALEMGMDKLLMPLAQMEFQHLSVKDNAYLAIGGMTNGVTAYEMAKAYAAIVNNGHYYATSNIVEIQDAVTGETLLNNSIDEVKKVFSPETAYMLKEGLREVLTSGTAKGYMPKNYPHTFGKTGTTNDYLDSWMVGANEHYTVAVWVGYDTPQSLTNSEQAYAKQLFKTIQETVLMSSNKVDVPFTKEGGVYYSNGEWRLEASAVSAAQKTRWLAEETRRQKERAWQENRLATIRKVEKAIEE